jgi:hypothetical protein
MLDTDTGHWTVDSGQWIQDNGQWTLHGQWGVETRHCGHFLISTTNGPNATKKKVVFT